MDSRASLKLGDITRINGDRWMIVDIAPAEPLAEMVATILEEEGFVVIVRGLEGLSDVFAHLGAERVGATGVFVPEEQGPAALELIKETVTDYEGEDLKKVLEELGDDYSAEDLEALGLDEEDLAAVRQAVQEDGSRNDAES